MDCGKAQIPDGLKQKDLVGVPWRVALAMQADGWWLRSDIIWHKKSPMPESVTDRPTKSHEYIFLLTKAQTYFYDHVAIMEESSYSAGHEYGSIVARIAAYESGDERFRTASGLTGLVSNGTRNKRSVWTVGSAPYKGAHFATFPPDLIKPCILAGTSAHGCCAKCGSPWERIIELGEPDLEHQQACGGDDNGEYFGEALKDYDENGVQNASDLKRRILEGMRERKTIGWKPTCDCGTTEVVPCTVLDPFGGSGTTGMVSLELGRNAILIELNPNYIPLIKDRTNITPGLALA